MYNNAGSMVGGTLAATGLMAQSLWMVLGAFALISAGVALRRMAPREQA
jgi:LPXTG-motif cell wall-anchored protein